MFYWHRPGVLFLFFLWTLGLTSSISLDDIQALIFCNPYSILPTQTTPLSPLCLSEAQQFVCARARVNEGSSACLRACVRA